MDAFIPHIALYHRQRYSLLILYTHLLFIIFYLPFTQDLTGVLLQHLMQELLIILILIHLRPNLLLGLSPLPSLPCQLYLQIPQVRQHFDRLHFTVLFLPPYLVLPNP